jgi:segregation and condensation protein B
MSLVRNVEAVLFAGSKRMSVDEITALFPDHSQKDIIAVLNLLAKEYEERDSAIVLSEDEGLWKLALRDQYLPLAEKLMPSTELPRQVVETLALLAWKAPMLQSDVIKMRTTTAYEHISELERLGLITRARQGRSYVVKLTEKFYEYFDVPKERAAELFREPEEVIEETEEATPEPTFDELLNEVKENKIDPSAIIAQDKAFLDSFEERLKQVQQEGKNTDQTLKQMDASDAQEILKQEEKKEENEENSN